MQKTGNYRYYLKRYIEVGLPILLTSLSPVLMAVTDNAMVGYLGEEVRAAAAFSNVITATPFLLLIGISSVLMPLVAGAVVDNNYDKATRVLKYSVLVNMFCGVLCVLVLSVMVRFLDRMGQDEQVVALARGGYFQIIVASILLNSVSQPLKRYLDGLGFRFSNTGLSFLSTGMNGCLNYLLIDGHYGFPALGLNGAAIATFASRFMILIIYLSIVWRFRKKGYITSLWFDEWDQPYFMKILKLGLPSGFELAMKMVYLNVINIMIGWMGVNEQSSASILFAMIRVGLMLPVAIGTAGSILLAEEWRKGNKGEIRKIRQAAYLLTIVLMLMIGLALWKIFPMILGSIFHPAEEVRVLVSALIAMVILFQIADGLTFVGSGLLRGMRDTFVPFLVTTLVSFLVGLPMSYYFAFYAGGGLYGIFEGVIIGLFLSAVLLYLRFTYKIRKLGL